jgi:hypothetical protein
LLKGAGKSMIAAALAVAECVAHPGTWIDIAACDRDQADIVRGFAAGLGTSTPALRGRVKSLKDRMMFDSGSVLQVLSADEPSAHGTGGRGRRYRVILDELSLWPDLGLAHALLASTGKVKNVQTLILSNPGATKSGEAWRLREQARQGAAGWFLYAPEDTIAPGWISEAWREQMRTALPPQLYERFIKGRWADGPDAAFTREMLEACEDPAWGPQSSGTTGVEVGVDIGLRHDSAAIEIVGWRGDLLYRFNGGIADPREFPDGEVPIELIENELLRLATAFPVRKIYADTWQFAGSRQRLEARMPIEDFSNNVPNQEKMSKTLYNLIASKRLRLYHDPDLIDELVALRTVVSPRGFRLDHRPGLHNDRTVALAMACYAAAESGPSRPITSADFCLGGSRISAVLQTAGAPHDRQDVWISATPRQGDRSLADELMEGEGGAFEGTRGWRP